MNEPETDSERKESARRKQDAQDLANELEGIETGRMPRFVSADSTQKARQERNERRSLDRLVGSLALQVRLDQFSSRLDELEKASLAALRAAERRQSLAEARLDDVRKHASRDAAGAIVYRTANGRYGYYDDARQLTDDQFKDVEWDLNAPTWEERTAAGQNIDNADREVQEIADYRERLSHAKERLSSDLPPEEDELAALEAAVENMPASVRAFDSGPAGQTQDRSSIQGIAPHFNGVAGESDIAAGANATASSRPAHSPKP